MAEVQPFRSLNHDIETFVKFVNKTDRTVFLFWIGYDGKIVNYGTIRPRKDMEMQTYVTHPWIVKDQANSFSLLMNGMRVFFPREHVNDIPFENGNCDIIDIHIPVFTLLQRCAEVVFHQFGRDSLKKLNLPRELKETLANMTGPSYDRSYHTPLSDDDDHNEN